MRIQYGGGRQHSHHRLASETNQFCEKTRDREQSDRLRSRHKGRNLIQPASEETLGLKAKMLGRLPAQPQPSETSRDRAGQGDRAHDAHHQ